MELYDYRYTRRNGSIGEFLEAEGRHRGLDVRQAPFKSSVEEQCEPYMDAKGQPPSYRHIEMNNLTFSTVESESSQLLGKYDPRLPSRKGCVAFPKATTKRTDADPQSGAHSYDNPTLISSEIWRAGPKIGTAQRPCSAEAVKSAQASANAAAAAANARELAVTSPRSSCNDPCTDTDQLVANDDTGKLELDAMRLEVGLRGWVEGGPHGGRSCGVAFIGRVPELGLGWWVGVDYDQPLGKNDGTINGVRYFDSDPDHGGFVRPWKLRMGEFDPEDYELEKIAKAQEKAQKEKEKRLDAMKSELDPITAQPFDTETARAHAIHSSFRGSVDRFGDYISERFVGGDSEMRELDAGKYADKLTPRQWQRHDLTITKQAGHQTITTSRPDSVFVIPKSKARKRKPVDKSSRSRQEQQQRPNRSLLAPPEVDPVDNSLYPQEILRLLVHSDDKTAQDSEADDAGRIHLRSTKIGDSAALQRQQVEHSMRLKKARRKPRPTSASFHGPSTEVRKIHACRSGGLNGTSNRRPSSGDHRSGVEPHYSLSWDEQDWKKGRTTSGGSSWGGSVVGRFESRLGFSELSSSDMPLTKENGDMRPLSRSSATSISSIESFVNEHGVDVRSGDFKSSSSKRENDRRRRSSSAGRERPSHVGEVAAEKIRRRPASAGWSGGQGPVLSIDESTSLVSLAKFVEAAVDSVTRDQAKARRQSKSMARLMSAGKRPELIRSKVVAKKHQVRQALCTAGGEQTRRR